MTHDQLRAYAIAGVAARIAALEDELSELKAVQARLVNDGQTVQTRPVERARVRTRAVTAAALPADAARVVAEPTSPDAPEPARILARRGRLPRPTAVQEPQNVLPPMPRLIKAKAS